MAQSAPITASQKSLPNDQLMSNKQIDDQSVTASRPLGRRILALAGVLLSGLYLLNFSFGVFFELPDNLPIVGNLDEVAVSAFFFGCLSYLGINLVPFRKDRKEQPVELNTNSSDD